RGFNEMARMTKVDPAPAPGKITRVAPAISCPGAAYGLLHHFGSHRGRYFAVALEFHRIAGAALRLIAYVRAVAEHLGERHLRRTYLVARLALAHAEHDPAAAGDVAMDRAGELVRHSHFHAHHRFEDLGRALLHRRLHGDGARGAEGHL